MTISKGRKMRENQIDFCEIISNFCTIIGDVSRYVTHLPPRSRYRLATWLVFEKIIRKPALPPAGKKISRQVQRAIEKQVALFAGYMVIFAHDDAVDKYNLQTEQIYDQLSRCLAAFLLGLLFEPNAATVNSLRRELEKWLYILQKGLTDFPEISMELPYLLNSPFLDNVPGDEKVSIQHLLIRQGYDTFCQEWLNASIVSALGMGRAFKKLSLLLRQSLGEAESGQRHRYEFFIQILVKCMYAQAHSPEQKTWEGIEYGRFIELSYLKSTILIDLYNYVSDQVNENRFFATRHNASRACDQIFDDLQDYEEDTRDQVLGILHMHILEQGRLAEKFLSLFDGQKVSLELVRESIGDSQILRTTYDQTFVYHNPYVQAKRDADGNVCIELDQAEMILREVWVNAPDELKWTLEKLAKHRLALSQRLKQAWLDRDIDGVLTVLHQSNFPIALSKSLFQFAIRHKRVMLDSYAQHGALRAGYVGYYAVILGLGALQATFWLKRLLQLGQGISWSDEKERFLCQA